MSVFCISSNPVSIVVRTVVGFIFLHIANKVYICYILIKYENKNLNEVLFLSWNYIRNHSIICSKLSICHVALTFLCDEAFRNRIDSLYLYGFISILSKFCLYRVD